MWDNGVIVDKSESCVESGIKKFTCLRCGETKDETYYADHAYGEWECVQKESCTQVGIYKQICSVCYDEDYKYIADGHQYNEGTITKQSTCTESGNKLFTCTVCGATKNEEIEALGHDLKTIDYKAPTCTSDGYHLQICQRCGMPKFTPIPGGHKFVECYDGNYHWKECTSCSYVIGKEVHTLKLNVHTETKDDGAQLIYVHMLKDECLKCDYEKLYGTSELHIHYAVEIINDDPPACTEDGYLPGLKCAVSGCDLVLIEPEPCSALGHLWENCLCMRCGETLLEMELSDDGSYYIFKGIGEYIGQDLVIPPVYNNLPVKEVAEMALMNYTGVTSITIPNSVLIIGEHAFAGCRNAETIIIGNNVEIIGVGAFWGCDALTSIIIPDSTKVIDQIAFWDCANLSSVVIGNQVTTINSGAFMDCDKITTITIPKSVTHIEETAFSDCANLVSIIVDAQNVAYKSIDGNLYTIDGKTLLQYAPQNSATSFIVPENVIEIGAIAFGGCENLVSVKLPDGITEIKYLTFSGCVNLENINFPENLTKIDSQAFLNCKIKTVDIGSQVAHIYTSAFSCCYYLTSINVDENNSMYKSIDGNLYTIDGKTLVRYASGKTDKCFSIPNGVTIVKGEAVAHSLNLESVIIPDSVVIIEANAFSECRNLKELEIGIGVSTVGSYAFSGCNYKLFTEYEHATYVGDDDNPYAILIEVLDKNLNTYIINEKTQTIAYGAFSYCTNMIHIDIPSNIKQIGERAFEFCENLASITIPDKVEIIGDYAFAWCQNLSSITIGDRVSYIGESAFYDCQNLVKVNINSVVAWCNITFEEWYSNPLHYTKALYLCNELITDLVIPDGVTTINSTAFSWCLSLTSVTIPQSVIKIGFSAFNATSNITDVYYEGSSEDWLNIDFEGYSSIKSANIHFNCITY